MPTLKPEFSEADRQAYTAATKVGLLASLNEQGQPHICLITTIQANGPQELIMGEFVTGVSKKFIQQNHRVAFLIMTLNRQLWRGQATWTHLTKEGPEYERLNLIPMFRYNTYFGINTVHFFDLVGVAGPEALPMPAIMREALKTAASKGRFRTGRPERILKPFLEKMFNQLTTLKFLAYVAPDGYPRLVPLIQCQAADSRRLVFSQGVYADELKAIPAGATAAIFCMNFGIEDILVRGTFNGFKPSPLGPLGSLEIEWVYNSMPPATGQIYPEIELKPVTDFGPAR